MLTGCRKSEILTLRWTDVDLDAGDFHLGDSKSGPRLAQLTPTAVELLQALPQWKDSPWVFPGNDRDGRYSCSSLDHAWRTVPDTETDAAETLTTTRPARCRAAIDLAPLQVLHGASQNIASKPCEGPQRKGSARPDLQDIFVETRDFTCAPYRASGRAMSEPNRDGNATPNTPDSTRTRWTSGSGPSERTGGELSTDDIMPRCHSVTEQSTLVAAATGTLNLPLRSKWVIRRHGLPQPACVMKKSAFDFMTKPAIRPSRQRTNELFLYNISNL